MHIGVGIIRDQKSHHHTVGKGAGGTDGYQRIHVGISVNQRLEAAGEEMAAAVQHRDGQQQLQDGKVHRMGVHGEEIRQRQRRQSEGKHLSHGHI